MPSIVKFNDLPGEYANTRARINAELAYLADPVRLEERLDRIDRSARFSRAYVMGCGRSGTWMMTALLGTLRGADVLAKELPVQWFGMLRTKAPLLVLKRDWRSYEKIEDVPARVDIVYIIRHPYDVLTSHNPTTSPRVYHVPPYQLLGNMLSLQYLMETKRARTLIFKYEDLVKDPEAGQQKLMQHFGLHAKIPAERIDLVFSAKPKSEGTLIDADRAMHGIRKIDQNSVEKFRRDPEKLEYLRRIRPRLGKLLEWVADSFGYDVSLRP